MADTKRGRERKGRLAERRRYEREIERALAHRDEEFDVEALYAELAAEGEGATAPAEEVELTAGGVPESAAGDD